MGQSKSCVWAGRPLAKKANDSYIYKDSKLEKETPPMKISPLQRLLALSLLVSLTGLASAEDAAKPIAKIGSTVLTEEDMRKDMGMQLYQAENNIYGIERNWVDQKAQ